MGHGLPVLITAPPWGRASGAAPLVLLLQPAITSVSPWHAQQVMSSPIQSWCKELSRRSHSAAFCYSSPYFISLAKLQDSVWKAPSGVYLPVCLCADTQMPIYQWNETSLVTTQLDKSSIVLLCHLKIRTGRISYYKQLHRTINNKLLFCVAARTRDQTPSMYFFIWALG